MPLLVSKLHSNSILTANRADLNRTLFQWTAVTVYKGQRCSKICAKVCVTTSFTHWTVLQSFVLCLFYIFCISSDCTLKLGIVDLCWLGFVGKVRSEGLEGRARAPQSKPDSPILGMSFSAPQQDLKD